MTASSLVLLDLALLAIMILASRAALVLHEVGGHAVPALILGASTVEVRLSPLGGGFVNPQFRTRPSDLGMAIFTLGGIALNLITGALAWFWARRLKSRDLGYVALLFLGVGSVAGAISYLACGLYYGSGDPVGLSPATEDISHLQGVWVLLLPAAAAVGWFGPRHYLEFLSGHAGLDSGRRRLCWAAATVGLAGLGYFGLWLSLKDPKIEGSTRSWRLQQEIAKETERRVEKAKCFPTPAAPLPPGPVPVVRPEEVADRVPPPVGPIVLYTVFLTAGLASVIRASPARRESSLRPGSAIGLATLAAGAVAVFAAFG